MSVLVNVGAKLKIYTEGDQTIGTCETEEKRELANIIHSRDIARNVRPQCTEHQSAMRFKR